jgi:ribonuclease E
MSKIMLIDAAHAEETRVAVVDGHHIDEFDFESRAVKQLRGNIYLAKVTRVEPSLQAAFIEYGGGRHGFLAFDAIHPDYYQIPHADRAALLRDLESGADHPEDDVDDADHEDEADAELERRKRRLLRRYKIQEVIKRRQIMLVQVVKEERGNKGAALTTYLSLAGRYCVLMPNTNRGGGISRKITAATDRKRLKSVVSSLAVPEGMGLIVRTAGAKRTKAEIKRDYEYLMRLWENIRDNTLKSIAPALIYEEEDLVKRAIRDLYDKELDGIFVEGEDGYREAKDFMRMLMPSQSKKVIAHREPVPLFVRYGVEAQLGQIHSPVVPLRSGGYLVINQTEALVAVDVNSGRATKERNVEATALKTNMEAAEEAARQLRLRDLAGLIVIDFIDMDEAKNNRAVEKKLKDCLADDRARVQMGKISGFGLMEISRQRRRSGVLEGTTHTCPHCSGLGRIRSVESAALEALRSLQIEAARGGTSGLTLRVCTEVGLYILNQKRAWLAQLEESAGLAVTVAIDEDRPMGEHVIDRAPLAEGEEPRVSFQPPARPAPVRARPEPVEEEEDEDVADEDEDEDEEDAADASASGGESRPRSEGGRDRDQEARGGRRRRRRRGGRRDDAAGPPEAVQARSEPARVESDANDEGSEEERRGRRRRGRRGGRRREEERGRDVYAWFRPRSEDPADSYAWSDPHAARPQAAPLAAEVEPVVMPEAVVEIATESAPEPTLEAGAPAEKPRRARTRSRGGRRTEPKLNGADAATSEEAEAMEPAPAEVSAPATLEAGGAEPTEQTSPEPPTVEAAPEPAPEPTPEPVLTLVSPEPAAEVEAIAPPPPPEPDPAEIVTPPEQPKRGWWRRRG